MTSKNKLSSVPPILYDNAASPIPTPPPKEPFEPPTSPLSKLSSRGSSRASTISSRGSERDEIPSKVPERDETPYTVPERDETPSPGSASSSEGLTKGKYWLRFCVVGAVYITCIVIIMIDPLIRISKDEGTTERPQTTIDSSTSDEATTMKPKKDDKLKEVLDLLSIGCTIGTVIAAGLVWFWRQCVSFPADMESNPGKKKRSVKRRGCLNISVFSIFVSCIILIMALYVLTNTYTSYEGRWAATSSAFTIGALLSAGIVACLKKVPIKKWEDVEDQGLQDPSCKDTFNACSSMHKMCCFNCFEV